MNGIRPGDVVMVGPNEKRQRFRHALERELRCRVSAESGEGELPAETADVHDRAAALIAKRGQRCPQYLHRAEEVGLHLCRSSSARPSVNAALKYALGIMHPAHGRAVFCVHGAKDCCLGAAP